MRRADFEVWLDVVVIGFATPDLDGLSSSETLPPEVLEPAIRSRVSAEGSLLYMALLGGKLVGGASLFIEDGLAQLTGAATIPALRRRGVQSELLAVRLAEAARQEGEFALVTTQHGSPFKGYCSALCFRATQCTHRPSSPAALIGRLALAGLRRLGPGDSNSP